jgi:hypothetical protein
MQPSVSKPGKMDGRDLSCGLDKYDSFYGKIKVPIDLLFLASLISLKIHRSDQGNIVLFQNRVLCQDKKANHY